jgi:pimeloyl-ACP methyl ester carboxylesterase
MERRRYQTAGFPSTIHLGDLPSDVAYEFVTLKAEDGGVSRGILYTKKGTQPKTAVTMMHPRTDHTLNYTAPVLARAGFAAFGRSSRWVNNDVATIHETLLFDVAAGMKFLRERDFEKIVFLGNSGGGSLFTFYQNQAVTPPPGRLTATPAGDPVNLNDATLPPGDGMIFLAAHIGEGETMLHLIDPAVTDEHDPLSCDAALDMYNPDNGFRTPPQQSRYSAEFLTRYRAAQAARVARLDAIARQAIAEQRNYQEIMQDAAFSRLSSGQQALVQRRAVLGRYLVIYRTEADPALCDLSLDPSDRDIGSLVSLRPDLDNYAEWGFGRYLTPRAWLSTWSATASHAEVLHNIGKVTVPTVVVYYTGDNCIYPSETRRLFEASPATDKQLHAVEGDHFGLPLQNKPNHPGGRARALQVITGWLKERFPL